MVAIFELVSLLDLSRRPPKMKDQVDLKDPDMETVSTSESSLIFESALALKRIHYHFNNLRVRVKGKCILRSER